jgi:hypothetical protein
MQTNIRRQEKAGFTEKSSWCGAKDLQHRVQQRKTVKDIRLFRQFRLYRNLFSAHPAYLKTRRH